MRPTRALKTLESLANGVHISGNTVGMAFDEVNSAIEALIAENRKLTEQNEAYRERLEEVAHGEISTYIEAVEEGHLYDDASWVHQEEHYEYCLKRGREIAELIGKDPDKFEKEIREYLCEEYGYGDDAPMASTYVDTVGEEEEDDE
jgi:regulator of replication initiation timing